MVRKRICQGAPEGSLEIHAVVSPGALFLGTRAPECPRITLDKLSFARPRFTDELRSVEGLFGWEKGRSARG